jgi:hypothetical protein
MEHLTGSIGTFQERMATSASIMEKINKLAQEFSLPSGDLLDMSKLLAATLVPKGLAGTNFGTAIDISRNFLKAAPTLGVDPGLAKGQLLDAIQGRASMGDTLFQRLMNETAAFKPFNKQGGPQAFNALPAPERVKLVGLALKQFASDMDVLKGNAMSLSGEMRRLGRSDQGTVLHSEAPGGCDPGAAAEDAPSPEWRAPDEGQGDRREPRQVHQALHRRSAVASHQHSSAQEAQVRHASWPVKRWGSSACSLGVAHVLKFLGVEGTVARIAMSSFIDGPTVPRHWLYQRSWVARGLLMWLTGASTVFGALFAILDGLVVVASRVLCPSP